MMDQFIFTQKDKERNAKKVFLTREKKKGMKRKKKTVVEFCRGKLKKK